MSHSRSQSPGRSPSPPPSSKLKGVVVLAAAESKRQKSSVRGHKKQGYGDQRKSGVDDGTSAQKLLMKYVDQVLEQVESPDARKMPDHAMGAKSFKESTFLEKLQHPNLLDIPLHSQTTRQKALEPIHKTGKMNLFIGVCDSLRRNDGGMVRARLSGEMVDDKVIKMVATALPDNVYLQHIMLHDNVITDLGVEALCMSLRWHPSIQTIWLGGNLISDRGAIALATLLGRNPNIIDLNLSNKRPRKSWGDSQDIVHPEVTYLGAEAFAKQFRRSCGLTSLSLAEHKIRDIGARMLFKALRNSKLRSLNLKANGLTSGCCLALRDALLDQPVLEKLVLSRNDIDDDGVTDICQGLAHNTVLQALDLSYCKLQDRGIQAILLCLEKNQALSALNTMYNLSPDDRADRIIDMRAAATRALDMHLDRMDKKSSGVAGLGPPMSAGTMSTLQGISEESFKLARSEPAVDLAAIAMPSRARAFLSSRGESRERTSLGSRGGSRGSSRARSRGGSPRSPARSRAGSLEGDMGSPPPPPSPHSPPSSASEKGNGRGLSPTAGSSRGRASRRGGGHEDDDAGLCGLDLTTGWKECAARKTPNIPTASVGGMRPRSRPLRGESAEGERASRAGSRGASRGGSRDGALGGSASPSRQRAATPGMLPTVAWEGEGGAEDKEGHMQAFLELFEIEADAMQRDTATARGKREYVITERMRLGHLLPNSPYRRFFEDKERPSLSRELGLTRGVPSVGNVGIMPVRNVTNRFKDSAQHLTYLRIATPDDPPDARPISLIQIALDQRAYAEKIRAERQTPLYKELKRDALDFVPRGKQRAAANKIPADFWDKWKRKMRTRYPRGIDKADKVRSTDMKEFKRPITMVNGKPVLDKVKAAIVTPGQALVYRKEQRAKRLSNERAAYAGEQSTATIGHAKRLAHDILGLRADQPITDVLNRHGLTTKIGLVTMPESFITKEFKAY